MIDNRLISRTDVASVESAVKCRKTIGYYTTIMFIVTS